MKFDNETSIIQQKIANGYAGVSRRLAIVNALNLETNETVIDIGCGGGHLVQEISLSIGELFENHKGFPLYGRLDISHLLISW